MARLETSTQVDKKIYTRVKSTKEKVDRFLIDSLVARGIKEEAIQFEYEDISTSGCCPQMKVTAYATFTKKKRAQDILDDKSN